MNAFAIRVLGALLLLLAWVAPAFFSARQMTATLTATAPILVVACGMTLVILSRQIDISVGSQFAWCSVLAGLLAKAGWPMAAVAVGAVAAGAAFGAFNAMLVAGLTPAVYSYFIWRNEPSRAQPGSGGQSA